MLKYKCLLCGIEWGNPQASESDISHGCCPKCIRGRYTDRIHRSQRQQGYSDCFNRGYNDCTEDRCRFRAACQDASVRRWTEEVIETPKILETGNQGA
jgi:hypothetical protein